MPDLSPSSAELVELTLDPPIVKHGRRLRGARILEHFGTCAAPAMFSGSLSITDRQDARHFLVQHACLEHRGQLAGTHGQIDHRWHETPGSGQPCGTLVIGTNDVDAYARISPAGDAIRARQAGLERAAVVARARRLREDAAAARAADREGVVGP